MSELNAVDILLGLQEKLIMLEKRVFELEGKNERLEEKIQTLTEERALSSQYEGGYQEKRFELPPSMERSRVGIIDYLIAHLNQQGYEAEKGSRAVGGEILITSPKQEVIKCYYSTNTGEIVKAWSSVQRKHVEDERIDQFLFAITFPSHMLVLLIPQKKIKEMAAQKKEARDGKYHFEFSETNHKILETRDGVTFDVTPYIETFSSPS